MRRREFITLLGAVDQGRDALCCDAEFRLTYSVAFGVIADIRRMHRNGRK